MCQKRAKLLTKCHTLKKEKTADKVPCIKKIYNKKMRLLTVCNASKVNFI